MEIYDFIIEQGRILGLMFVCGVLMAVLYDMIRVVRRLLQVSRMWVHITDFFYWPTALFFLWLIENEWLDGSIRICQFVFVILGMFCYLKLLSKGVIWIIYTSLAFCAKQIQKLDRYILHQTTNTFYKVYQSKWINKMKESKESENKDKKYEQKTKKKQKEIK